MPHTLALIQEKLLASCFLSAFNAQSIDSIDLAADF